mmetsp:Transcript_25670/g.72068  ORF Transcript_25670/g.72068 Transcript_25670/m.72068 type:complete len:114 (+) Transcript_25670:672-1013(+)
MSIPHINLSNRSPKSGPKGVEGDADALDNDPKSFEVGVAGLLMGNPGAMVTARWKMLLLATPLTGVEFLGAVDFFARVKMQLSLGGSLTPKAPDNTRLSSATSLPSCCNAAPI